MGKKKCQTQESHPPASNKPPQCLPMLMESVRLLQLAGSKKRTDEPGAMIMTDDEAAPRMPPGTSATVGKSHLSWKTL